MTVNKILYVDVLTNALDVMILKLKLVLNIDIYIKKSSVL